MIQLQAIREHLRVSLWFLPALFAVAAVVVALVLLAVDDHVSRDPGDFFFLYGGTAEGARSVLSTIAQSMLTFTGLVFTITMLVLQLASSQLSPRVMRTFLRDRSNQGVLGVFVATFVYTLVVLREVRTDVDGDGGFVPGLSIWVGFALLLGSVAAFIYYIEHMAHAIRASTVIASIAAETEAAIERLYPASLAQAAGRNPMAVAPDGTPAGLVLKASRAGILVAVDEGALLRAVGDGERHLALIPAVGDFVPRGGPLVRLCGQWDAEASEEIRDAIGLEDERTLEQDAAFGFRQLVDVAVRALSPGTNDPTTAVQALDRLHDLLRQLAERDIPSPLRTDDAGRVRLIFPRPGWNDYVQLAVDEIRLAGEGQIQVSRRLRALLDDVSSVAPDDRQPVLRRQLALIDSSVRRSFADALDADTAGRPSARGHALVAPSATPRSDDELPRRRDASRSSGPACRAQDQPITERYVTHAIDQPRTSGAELLSWWSSERLVDYSTRPGGSSRRRMMTALRVDVPRASAGRESLDGRSRPGPSRRSLVAPGDQRCAWSTEATAQSATRCHRPGCRRATTTSAHHRGSVRSVADASASAKLMIPMAPKSMSSRHSRTSSGMVVGP